MNNYDNICDAMATVSVTSPSTGYTINGDSIGPYTSNVVGTIKGQLVEVSRKIPAVSFKDSDPEAVKLAMVRDLAEELIKNKLVEFTRQEDQSTHVITIRARIYATPDDQVRLLRSTK